MTLSILHERQFDPIQASLEHFLVRSVGRDERLVIDFRLAAAGTINRKRGQRRDFFAAATAATTRHSVAQGTSKLQTSSTAGFRGGRRGMAAFRQRGRKLQDESQGVKGSV